MAWSFVGEAVILWCKFFPPTFPVNTKAISLYLKPLMSVKHYHFRFSRIMKGKHPYVIVWLKKIASLSSASVNLTQPLEWGLLPDMLPQSLSTFLKILPALPSCRECCQINNHWCGYDQPSCKWGEALGLQVEDWLQRVREKHWTNRAAAAENCLFNSF